MKKYIFVFVLTASVSTATWALGFGVQGSIVASDSMTSSLALAISPNRSMHMTLDWNIGDGQDHFNRVGLTFDWWLTDFANVRTMFYFFLGAGLYGSLIFEDDNFNFGSGLRVPFGLSAGFANDHVELYLQAVPTIGLIFKPTLKTDDFTMPVNLGVRFWI